jgi:hypothetical protein
MPDEMNRAIHLLFLGMVAALICACAQAQGTTEETSPEIDVYVRLNEQYRLDFSAERSTDGSTYDSINYGATLDIQLKPIVRKRIDSNNSAKHKYLTFAVGYHYLTNFNKPDENRIDLDLTPRYVLPWSLLLGDRNRFELRLISGAWTWRYRNRLAVERPFRIRSFRFSPYMREEVFYNSKYGTWGEDTYEVGAIFPVRKRIELQPYLEHTNQTHSSPQHVNTVGLTANFYF